MDIAGVDVEIDVIKELPELEDLEVNASTEDQSFTSNKYGFKNVIIKGIKGEKLDLNPSLEQQNLKGVFTEVNINPIQTKKINITPTTQEQVITGLIDEVVVNAIEGQELNLNPSENQQNYEGVFLGVNINPIQVEDITTDLDFSASEAIELTSKEGGYIKTATINKPINLKPENIKSGETICGIDGINADTSDADATSNDIIVGKTAYVANEKIAGTYIPLDTSDATATASDITKDKTAYVNGEKIIGTKETEASEYNAKLGVVSTLTTNFYPARYLLLELDLTGVDLKNIYNFKQAFASYSHLRKCVGINTSKATTFREMFSGCSELITVDEMNASNLTMDGCLLAMFDGCPMLSNESLNNILAMCAKAVNYKGTKTLYELRLSSAQATVCQSLSNYQAFLDAGWTIGY